MLMCEAMHRHFGINYAGPPRHLSTEEREFRIACLREELQEYIEAGTLIEQYDALLDLIVFALGTLHRQGLPFIDGFTAVMSANMRKKVGGNAKRGGFSIDLVKPEGFVGPETALRRILNDRTNP